MSLIRDAEIEDTIRAYAAPLLEAAGFDTGAVRFHIVNDPGINAFVAGGPNLFIGSGMLAVAEEPGEIIGVIAHEIGHIAGGHLVRTRDAMEDASTEMILAAILGAGAIIAGQGEVGGAIVSGGQAMAQQSFMHYSQAQEQNADQAAIRLLESTGTVRGGPPADVPEARRAGAALHRAGEPLSAHPPAHARAHSLRPRPCRGGEAGGAGHGGCPGRAPRRPPADGGEAQGLPRPTGEDAPRPTRPTTSRPKRVTARAIAYYRIPDVAQSLAALDALLADHPDDPWFHELKGQVLFENARVDDAIAPYMRAVALRDDAALLRLGLARAQIESGDAALLPSAIEHLEAATRLERNEAQFWYQLGNRARPLRRTRHLLPRVRGGRLSTRRRARGAAPRSHRGEGSRARQRGLAQGGGHPQRGRGGRTGEAVSDGSDAGSAGQISPPSGDEGSA